MVVFEPRPRHPGMLPDQRVPREGRKRRLILPSRLLPRVAILAFLAFGLALPGIGSAQDGSPPDLEIKGVSGALVVAAEPRCSEIALRSPEVVVRWSIDAADGTGKPDINALLAASDFRIDYSKFPGGLESGRFQSLEVSASDATRGAPGDPVTRVPEFSAVARDLRAGVFYRARVLVKTPDGWVTSSQVGFLSSVCPADGIED